MTARFVGSVMIAASALYPRKIAASAPAPPSSSGITLSTCIVPQGIKPSSLRTETASKFVASPAFMSSATSNDGATHDVAS